MLPWVNNIDIVIIVILKFHGIDSRNYLAPKIIVESNWCLLLTLFIGIHYPQTNYVIFKIYEYCCIVNYIILWGVLGSIVRYTHILMKELRV